MWPRLQFSMPYSVTVAIVRRHLRHTTFSVSAHRKEVKFKLGPAILKLRNKLARTRHTCGPSLPPQPAGPAAGEQKQSGQGAEGAIGRDSQLEQEGQEWEEQERQAPDEHCDDARLGGLCCDLVRDLIVQLVFTTTYKFSYG